MSLSAWRWHSELIRADSADGLVSVAIVHAGKGLVRQLASSLAIAELVDDIEKSTPLRLIGAGYAVGRDVERGAVTLGPGPVDAPRALLQARGFFGGELEDDDPVADVTAVHVGKIAKWTVEVSERARLTVEDCTPSVSPGQPQPPALPCDLTTGFVEIVATRASPRVAHACPDDEPFDCPLDCERNAF